MRLYTVVYGIGGLIKVTHVDTETQATLLKTLEEKGIIPAWIQHVFEGHCQLTEGWRK